MNDLKYNVVPLFPSCVVQVRVEGDTSELLQTDDVPVLASASEESNPNNINHAGNSGDPYYWGTGSNVRVLERFPKTKEILLNTFSKLANEALGYKKKQYAITTSWLTITNRGEGSSLHCHKNSFWSCVYYYQKEYPDDGQGAILFDNPNTIAMDYYFQNSDIERVNEINSMAATFKPEPGLLIAFPSYLKHQVLTHNNNKVRKSLAFNVVPIDPYGEHDSSFDRSWVTPSLSSWKSR